jgi:ABC-2 type transport system ATP-binding protein
MALAWRLCLEVLLGPNGAGKTTTVRMLTSILRPTSGRASIMGFDVVKDANQVRASVGAMTEQHGLYGRMTANEYLDFFGQLYNQAKTIRQQRIDELLDQFGLSDAKKKRLSEFSKGMRQKLALARALIHDPPVLLLDEPTSAMDPDSARIVREKILDLKSSKRTILLSTHNLMEAETLADKIAIIRKGQIILQGTPHELKTSILGCVEYEAHFANGGLSDDLLLEFPHEIKLISRGRNFLRFQVERPETDNPDLLRYLLKKKLEVVSFQEIPQSLEQVYAHAVSQNGGDE